mmetsp:Transcript_3303/g.5999  ORF Transcript_3303/g.5999 Transcript_3303/m.5999 type:complete len:331 (-) Transcript_3303:655-1647(-)
MHDVAEFVEEGDDVVVAKQRRGSIRRRSRQVAKHAINRRLASVCPLQEVKYGGMIVFAIARMQVKVEVAHPLSISSIMHNKEFHLRIPSVKLFDLRKLEPQKFLIDGHGLLNYQSQWKVFPNLLMIYTILALEHQGVVEGCIPGFQLHGFRSCSVIFCNLASFLQMRNLQGSQTLAVCSCAWYGLVLDALQERRYLIRRSRHPSLCHEVCPRGVAEKSGSLLPELNSLGNKVQIVGICSVPSDCNSPACRCYGTILHDRQNIWVLQSKYDFSRFSIYALFNEIWLATLQLLLIESQFGLVLTQVGFEFRTDLCICIEKPSQLSLLFCRKG